MFTMINLLGLATRQRPLYKVRTEVRKVHFEALTEVRKRDCLDSALCN